MYERILAEIRDGAFYRDNFPNEGQRFVAWYLHRVLLLDVHATKAAITDGQLDKQIDAIVVEDGEERRIRVIQGKFIKPEAINAEPLREVLSAWTRLKDLPEAAARLLRPTRGAARGDACRARRGIRRSVRIADDRVPYDGGGGDLDAFRAEMGDDAAFGAGLTLVDSGVLEVRLAEAEQRELPS